MSSSFIPGNPPGQPKAGKDYADYIYGYRARLAALVNRGGLESHHLLHCSQRPGTVASNLRSYRAAAVRLGDCLYARSTHWDHGAYGKLHSLLGDDGLSAIKMLRSTPSEKVGATAPTSREAAQREAALTQKYVSPTAALYFDNQTQKYGIKMDLLVGSLSNLCKSAAFADHFCEARTFSMLKQVLRQLTLMHADKVWHLDIKPGNIMIFSDGRIRACDMGLARFEDEKMEPGTMAYVSPEAMLELEHRERGDLRDLWALGLSALDQLVPLKHTPFDPKQGFSIYGTLEYFMEWHESMCTDGEFDLSKLLSSDHSDIFTKMFVELDAKSRRICRLLANHFLVRPEVRASAATALNLCEKAFPDAAEAESLWLGQVHDLTEHHDFRKVHQAALKLRLDDERAATLDL